MPAWIGPNFMLFLVRSRCRGQEEGSWRAPKFLRRVCLHLQKGRPLLRSPCYPPQAKTLAAMDKKKRGRGVRDGSLTGGRTTGKTASPVSVRGLGRGNFDNWVRLSCKSKFRGQFGRFDSSGANLSLV
jgi:hypothetical protein